MVLDGNNKHNYNNVFLRFVQEETHTYLQELEENAKLMSLELDHF